MVGSWQGTALLPTPHQLHTNPTPTEPHEMNLKGEMQRWQGGGRKVVGRRVVGRWYGSALLEFLQLTTSSLPPTRTPTHQPGMWCSSPVDRGQLDGMVMAGCW